MTSSVCVLTLGQRLRPFASVEDAGALLGVSKATAYRHAEREGWPLVGGHGTHTRVNMVALCERIGLPYELVSTSAPARDDRDRHEVTK